MLKNGDPYSSVTPDKYLSPKMERMKQYLEAQKREMEQMAQMQEELFNMKFDAWQNTLLDGQDSFGAEAAQQACQSLYSASYALLDDGANDCELVVLSNQQLLTEFSDLGNDAEELTSRQAAYEQSVFDLLTAGKPKRETIIALKKLATTEEESSLGIALD